MPVLSAARLLLFEVEILACRARPSHHRDGPLNTLKRIDDIKRKIEANRINAKRSTGPKTAAGKNERDAMLCVTDCPGAERREIWRPNTLAALPAGRFLVGVVQPDLPLEA